MAFGLRRYTLLLCWRHINKDAFCSRLEPGGGVRLVIRRRHAPYLKMFSFAADHQGRESGLGMDRTLHRWRRSGQMCIIRLRPLFLAISGLGMKFIGRKTLYRPSTAERLLLCVTAHKSIQSTVQLLTHTGLARLDTIAANPQL